jgi:hypothetical protein
LIQKYLASTARSITIAAVTSVSTVAHIDTVACEVLIDDTAIPFETPIQVRRVD